MGIPRFWSNVLAAGIIAASYGRLRVWLVNVTDRYLFQKQYDYRELLRKFSDEVVVGIQDVKQLVEKTVGSDVDPDEICLSPCPEEENLEVPAFLRRGRHES